MPPSADASAICQKAMTNSWLDQPGQWLNTCHNTHEATNAIKNITPNGTMPRASPKLAKKQASPNKTSSKSMTRLLVFGFLGLFLFPPTPTHKAITVSVFFTCAEGVRFELTVPYGTPHFKCGALDHSATPPSTTIHFLCDLGYACSNGQ
jgi:hypothetical protein